MADEKKQALTPEELNRQQGEELPDREEMSLINANIAAPINAAVAANVLSDNSTATANAVQDAPITQASYSKTPIMHESSRILEEGADGR
jgi:hypothetical protein